MELPTRNPYFLGDELNIVNLFLTSNLFPYSFKIFSSLDFSGHLLLSVSCSFSSSLLQAIKRFLHSAASEVSVSLILHGMTATSMGGLHWNVLSALPMRFSLARRITFLIFFLQLNLTKLDLIFCSLFQ